MSLPNTITEGIKAIPYNPAILSSDPQLTYTLSFTEHRTSIIIQAISHDSARFHPRETYQSPLSQYQFADFDDATYNHLLS